MGGNSLIDRCAQRVMLDNAKDCKDLQKDDKELL